MPAIVLTTQNARYIHSALGLRYLYANLKELQAQTELMEFVIGDRPADVAEKILTKNPRLVGMAVYIWNAIEISQLIKVLRVLAPQLIIVLGGPEVSHSPLRVDYQAADYIIQGEGEEAFYRLCHDVLAGQAPQERIIQAKPVELAQLELPYEFYGDEDVRNRVIYIEASRGCPFACEFCLSSIDRRVRYFDTSRILTAIEHLWQRGVRHFKFIDRSFNLSPTLAVAILDDFLAREEGYMVHFEMVPDHLPTSLGDRLRRFPPGAVQLEIGIQTLNPEVAARIGRPLDMEKIADNLRFLSEKTQVHLHLDLILGLPGESLESMADGLNRLFALGRGEIQLGILKKLSGPAISRHDQPFGMVYSPLPPYELLQNNQLPFAQMQDLKRLTRYWDLFYNSGNFSQGVRLLWQDTTVFEGFWAFSLWVYRHTQATSQLSLERLAETLFNYLTEECGQERQAVAAIIGHDLHKIPGRHLPAILRGIVPEVARNEGHRAPKRQNRFQ